MNKIRVKICQSGEWFARSPDGDVFAYGETPHIAVMSVIVKKLEVDRIKKNQEANAAHLWECYLKHERKAKSVQYLRKMSMELKNNSRLALAK